MSVEFKLDVRQLKELETHMAQIPDKSERVINDYLHERGASLTKEEITSLLPVSKWKKQPRRKEEQGHAKYSRPFTKEEINLEFIVKSRGGAANKKGNYGYLVFPNEGRGPHNPVEQRFMERGLDEAVPTILKELNENLLKTIKEG